jgi:hypothetical protein
VSTEIQGYWARRHGKLVWVHGYSEERKAGQHDRTLPGRHVPTFHRMHFLLPNNRKAQEAKPARQDADEYAREMAQRRDAFLQQLDEDEKHRQTEEAGYLPYDLRELDIGPDTTTPAGQKRLAAVRGELDDIADAVGMPQSVIGLNHRLALKFVGDPAMKWLGRYRPADVQIEIQPRGMGGDTVAHEWGHFLDNMLHVMGDRENGRAMDELFYGEHYGEYFSEWIGKRGKAVGKGTPTPEGRVVWQRDPNTGLPVGEPDAFIHLERVARDSIEVAAAGVVKAIRQEKYEVDPKDSFLIDKKPKTMAGWARARKVNVRYYTDPTEMWSRAFAAYVDDKKHAAKGTPLITEGRFYPQGLARKRINKAFDNLFAVMRRDEFFEKAMPAMLAKAMMPAVHTLTRAQYADWLEKNELSKPPPRRRGVDPVKWKANIQEAIDHARGKVKTLSPGNVLGYDSMAAASRRDAAAKKERAKPKKAGLDFDTHGRVYYGPEHPDTINTGFRPAIASIRHAGKPARYAVSTEEGMRQHFGTASRAVKAGKRVSTLGSGHHRLRVYPTQAGAEADYKARVAAVPTAKQLREQEMAGTVTPELRKLYGKSFGRPTAKTQGEAGYHYHATVEEYLPDIAARGLQTHRPSFGTDQSSWPDGSTERRNYFTRNAGIAYSFAAGEGPSVLLRVHERNHPMRRESTGDTYSTKTVPAKHLEVLGDDGNWSPLLTHFPQQHPPRLHHPMQLTLPFEKAMKEKPEHRAPDDGPNPAEAKWWVAGRNKVFYPAFYNPLTQRLRIVEPDTVGPAEGEDLTDDDRPNMRLSNEPLSKGMLWDEDYHGPRWRYGMRYRDFSQLPFSLQGEAVVQVGGRKHPNYPSFGTVDFPRELTKDEARKTELEFVEHIPGKVQKALARPWQRLLWHRANASDIAEGLCNVRLFKAAIDPREFCPHCGARQERGDDGKCNRCRKFWPEVAKAVAAPPTTAPPPSPASQKPKVVTKKIGGGTSGPGKARQPKGHGWLSKLEIAQMNLKWVTVHPEGPGTEGQPVLVHDDGRGNLTVVGGAGGAMNQMVLHGGDRYFSGKQAEEQKQKRKAGKEEQAAAAAAAAEEKPEEFRRLEALRMQAKGEAEKHTAALSEMTQKLTGEQMGDLEKRIREEAAKVAQQIYGQAGEQTPRDYLNDLRNKDEKTKTPDQKKAQKVLEGLEARKDPVLDQKGLEGQAGVDIAEFQKEAEQQARAEAHAEGQRLLGQMIDQLADQIQRGEKPGGTMRVNIAGTEREVTFSGGDMMKTAQELASVATKRAQERAIVRALNTGRYDVVQGITDEVLAKDPSDAEVQKWIAETAINRASVRANTKLVHDASQASTLRQTRSQAQGATDALNGIVNDAIGAAIINPDIASVLGPEGTARVAAAYMREQGVNTAGKAEEIGARIKQTNYAAAVSALQTASELRHIGDVAMRSAATKMPITADASGKQFGSAAEVEAAAKAAGLEPKQFNVTRSGTSYAMEVIGDPGIQKAQEAGLKGVGEPADVTFAQAGVVARTMGAERLRRLNVARGEMRAAADLAQYLRYDPKEPLVIPGGSTVVETLQRAKELGLREGDYTWAKEAGEYADRYQILVKPASVTRLARPQTLATSQRAVEKHELVENLRDRMDTLGPAAYSNPDLQDGTEMGADGKPIKAVSLRPHQILGVEAIKKFKHEILNYGPGSGKTAIYYAAMSEMLHENPKMRGVMTMPAKPRAQQKNYKADDWVADAGPNGQGGWVTNTKTGEKQKFLKDDVANRIAVVNSGLQLKKAIERVNAGEQNFIVMSPELMRDHIKDLKDNGFMEPTGTAFFGDEAHEYATALGDKQSEKAKTAREFANSEYVVLGSGTLVQKSGSELYSLVNDFIAPKQLGSKTRFNAQWERLARQQASGGGEFTPEKVSALKQMLSPYMVSYHTPPTREGGHGELVQADQNLRIVPTTPAVREKVIEVNKQFEQALASPDPKKRAEAALVRDGKVNRILLNSVVDQVVDDVQKVINSPTKAGDQTLPGRVIVWSQEIGPNSPLTAFKRELKKRIGDEAAKFVSVTGKDSDRATQDAARKMNDFSSDTPGVTISNAANYGMNFQGASHIFMMGLPSVEQRQIIARALRFGQRRDVVHAANYITDHLFHTLMSRRTLGEREASVSLLEDLQDKPLTMSAQPKQPAGQPAAKSMARRNDSVGLTIQQEKNREKTRRALLSDETGAGKILLRHWHTIVQAAKGETNAADAESFGPHRLNFFLGKSAGKSGQAHCSRRCHFAFSRRAA